MDEGVFNMFSMMLRISWDQVAKPPSFEIRSMELPNLVSQAKHDVH